MNREKSKPEGPGKKKRSGFGRMGDKNTVWISVQELLSDVLGAFIPGVYFTFSILILFFLFVSSILYFVLPGSEQYRGLLTAVLSYFSGSGMVYIFVFGVCSYIIGSVFYRKDPKEPDRISAAYIYHRTRDKEDLAVRLSPDKKDLGVEFPYLYIKNYLQKRNYEYLAGHIPWDGKEPETYYKRTKMFINILKLRIGYYWPAELPEIAKNEAHVRLMSSLWYAVKLIKRASIASAVCGTAELVYCLPGVSPGLYLSRGEILLVPVVLVLVSLFLFGISWYIKHSITKFFHYQRVREIVYVLEIADLISKIYPEIFDQIDRTGSSQTKTAGRKTPPF